MAVSARISNVVSWKNKVLEFKNMRDADLRWTGKSDSQPHLISASIAWLALLKRYYPLTPEEWAYCFYLIDTKLMAFTMSTLDYCCLWACGVVDLAHIQALFSFPLCRLLLTHTCSRTHAHSATCAHTRKHSLHLSLTHTPCSSIRRVFQGQFHRRRRRKSLSPRSPFWFRGYTG